MYKTYQHKTLPESDKTLNHILDVIVEGTWDWNIKTGHVDRSPGWYRMLDYDIGIFQKNIFTWENIIHPDDYEQVMSHFESYISGKINSYCTEYRCKKADGSYLWIADQGKIVEYNADGNPLRMIGAHLNIHEQKTAQNELIRKNKLLQDGHLTLEKIISEKTEELEKKNLELEEKIKEVEFISNTDSLTSIANRKKFEQEIEKEISRSNRYNHPLSLIFFDIDFFKQINDNYGHKTGDEVLKNLCQQIKNNIRDIDSFARWGGEEFTIILPNLSLENALNTAEKLRQTISQFEILPDLFITCSFGVSEYKNGDNLNTLLHRADEALYSAKEHGRNRVEAQIES